MKKLEAAASLNGPPLLLESMAVPLGVNALTYRLTVPSVMAARAGVDTMPARSSKERVRTEQLLIRMTRFSVILGLPWSLSFGRPQKRTGSGSFSQRA